MANEEERISRLKEKVANLKTSLAIKEDNKTRLLKELNGYGIKTTDDATKKLDSITKEIDELETIRDEELIQAEKYLEQYGV